MNTKNYNKIKLPFENWEINKNNLSLFENDKENELLEIRLEEALILNKKVKNKKIKNKKVKNKKVKNNSIKYIKIIFIIFLIIIIIFTILTIIYFLHKMRN